ncbi:hypothetical protein [Pseudomonas syringae group genomosp. 3]|uniref:hypothetical protein n=1 Tax=Pseudomonas syringae group genomosp. 3 TaxID=251701 RepID=UPI000EFBF697|nr:hypothetical protein [Pseudomonas syringae group genomosp. 3]
MARHHNILEEDLPSQSDRERDRLRIEKAITEYFNRGGSIQRVEADQRVNDPSFIINAEKTALLKAGTESQKQKKANALSDTELARLLRAHCTAGSSLLTRKRCEAIARRYQIPFRSAAFGHARARS